MDTTMLNKPNWLGLILGLRRELSKWYWLLFFLLFPLNWWSLNRWSIMVLSWQFLNRSFYSRKFFFLNIIFYNCSLGFTYTSVHCIWYCRLNLTINSRIAEQWDIDTIWRLWSMILLIITLECSQSIGYGKAKQFSEQLISLLIIIYMNKVINYFMEV